MDGVKAEKKVPDMIAMHATVPDSGVRFTFDQIQLKRVTTLFVGHHRTDIDGSKGSTCPVVL